MKTITQKLTIIAGICVALVISACTGKNENDHSGDHATNATAEANYACPMHPEVTGKEGEECSKCGMKLELVSKEAASNDYFMDFAATPAVEAGKEAELSFTPKIKGKETEPVALDVQHDKKMHLIVVSKDLSYFDHIHPEYQADGSYKISVLPKGKNYSTSQFANETKFEQGGEYVLFADYLPTGATHQLERIELNVAGSPYKQTKFTQPTTVSKVDGFEVSLVPEGGKFYSKGTTHIAGIILRAGKEMSADDLENYLGAKAHVVVISEDTQDYLHVHPEVVDGRLDLHAEFGKPGIFRGWLQFQTEGKVHTADFVIKVEEGTAPESTHAAEGAEHKH